MKKNMGSVDRLIRLIAAGVIAILYFAGVVSGTVATMAGILGFVFVLTSAFGFCPLYVPLGISTFKKK